MEKEEIDISMEFLVQKLENLELKVLGESPQSKGLPPPFSPYAPSTTITRKISKLFGLQKDKGWGPPKQRIPQKQPQPPS